MSPDSAKRMLEAMKLALEAFEWSWGGEPMSSKELEAMHALRKSIEEAEKQEPVGYIFESPNKTSKTKFDECPHGGKWQPVYKHPPKREWLSLTPNKFGAVYVNGYGYIDKRAYFAVDAKLKELNHVL